MNYHPSLAPLLASMPDRIRRLPIDPVRQLPVPFFVGWIDGKPDFRFGDPAKIIACVNQRLCWTCGQALGRNLVFPIGPMCSITRTTAEPPSHLDCTLWSVKACPFLSRPKMVRREDELTEANKGNVSGLMIDRNPGVTCVWVCRDYKIFRDHNRKPLFRVGDPSSVEWFREGRLATRAEVEESVRTGLPALEEVAQAESPEAVAELAKYVEDAKRYWPKS
jgi:hypothetical protein